MNGKAPTVEQPQPVGEHPLSGFCQADRQPYDLTPLPFDRDLTVQQVVEMTGLSEHTLRYYERLGLLKSIRRDLSSGHRRYSIDDVARLETLACLRATGMSLEEMRQYMGLISQGRAAAEQQRSLLESHKVVLAEKMRQMQRNLDYLDYKIAYWNAVQAGDDQLAADIAIKVHEWIKSDSAPSPLPSKTELTAKR